MTTDRRAGAPAPARAAISGLAAALAILFAVGFAGADRRRSRGRIVKVDHRPPGDAPSVGPRHAAVTIEFFCDLSDRRSLTLETLLAELARRHPQRLRVVYRLVSKRARSTWQAEAAREAFAQGKFRELLAEFSSGGAWPQRGDVPGIAARSGLDLDRLERALSEDGDGIHADAVVADFHRARRRRLTAIPGLLVNGQPKALSQWTVDELEDFYDEAYEHAKQVMADGVPPAELYDRLLREVDARIDYPIGLIAGAVDGASAVDPPKAHGELIKRPIDTHTEEAVGRGPEDAAVAITFYCNLQTRNCKQMHDNLDELLEMFPTEVCVVFRHLYDPADKRQTLAKKLAEAAECADDQGEFWRFYDEMFSGYMRRGLSEDDILSTADRIGLDVPRLRGCLEQGAQSGRVEAARKAALRTGIDRTPSVVIGNRLYVGVQRTEVLRDLVLVELRPGLLEDLAR
jgi:protein-disulfide isomerase